MPPQKPVAVVDWIAVASVSSRIGASGFAFVTVGILRRGSQMDEQPQTGRKDERRRAAAIATQIRI